MAEDDQRSRGNYHTHALARGLLVLETVAGQAPPATLTDIHHVSRLPKSTLVRLISALVDEEYLVRVDERPSYRLGHKVMTLARSFVDSLSIPDLARRHLTGLAAQTRQTAELAVLDGPHVITVAVEHPERPLRLNVNVGDRASPTQTALGQVLLADHPTDAEPQAAQAPDQGFVDDDRERDEGLRSLAVPVSSGSRTLAALGVSGPAGEFDDRAQTRFLELLRQTARALERDATVVTALTTTPRPRG